MQENLFDALKCYHSHELRSLEFEKKMNKQVKAVDEEQIETDIDSYGEEFMQNGLKPNFTQDSLKNA